MSKITLSYEFEDADELSAFLAKINGKTAKPADEDEEPKQTKKKPAPADEDDEKPAKKSKPADEDDEKPAKGDKTTKLKNEIREKLRELAEKTERKTAVKLLNKYGESVDEVDVEQLDELLEKVEEAIEAA